MGIVWEASHKGVPLLGVPGITLDFFDTHSRTSRSLCHIPMYRSFSLIFHIIPIWVGQKTHSMYSRKAIHVMIDNINGLFWFW